MSKKVYISIVVVSIFFNVFLTMKMHATYREEGALLRNNIEYIMLYTYTNLNNFKERDELEIKKENIRDLRLFLSQSRILLDDAKLEKYNINITGDFLGHLFNQVNVLENTVNRNGALTVDQEELLDYLLENLKVILEELKSSESIANINIDHNRILEIMRMSF